MIYECYHCSAALPPGVPACPECGEPFDEAVPADAVLPKGEFSGGLSPFLSARLPLRKGYLVPALLVGITLFATVIASSIATVTAARMLARERQTPSRASAAPALFTAPVSLDTMPNPQPGALKVMLSSTHVGPYVGMGRPVTITAFATAAQNQDVTLALSYRKIGGAKILYSFSDGKMSSTTWTPAAPGRYQFTAVALNGSHQAAVSRSLWFSVSAPADKMTAEKPTTDRLTADRLTADEPSRARGAHSKRRNRSASRAGEHSDATEPSASFQQAAPPPGPLYHVMAAAFPSPEHAATLAEALRAQGLTATVRQQADKKKRVVYVVETGSYPQRDDAQKESLTLQRNGYPAYFVAAP